MRIEYVPRAQWGATQATEDFIAGRRVRTRIEKTEIHVHHTAAIDRDDSTPNRWDYDEAVAYMRRLQTVRPDLGPLPYSENLAVSEDAQTVWIFEGRGLLVSGAHTGGHNRPGIGWGCFGNFNHADPQAVSAIVDALSYRLTHLRREGFTKLGSVLSPTGRTVWGHRDSKSTSCPGDHLYARLDDITLDQQPSEEETIVSQLPTLRIYDGYRSRGRDHLQAPVMRAQALLAVEGFIASNTFDDQHRPDGLYGPGTEKAVLTFQGARQLPTHGQIDQATWARLLGVAS